MASSSSAAATKQRIRHPHTKCFQGDNYVGFNIQLPDARDIKYELQEKKFYFSAIAGPENVPYELDLELYKEVDPEGPSKFQVTGREITVTLGKEDDGHWERILKKPGKLPPWLSIDWDRWTSELERSEREEMYYNADYRQHEFKPYSFVHGQSVAGQGYPSDDDELGSSSGQQEQSPKAKGKKKKKKNKNKKTQQEDQGEGGETSIETLQEQYHNLDINDEDPEACTAEGSSRYDEDED